MNTVICLAFSIILSVVMMGEGAKYLIENGHVKRDPQPFPNDTLARVILVWMMTGMFGGIIMFNYYVLRVISMLMFWV